ncbi:hypothetical protein CDL12_23350 [Handroanthus impetiginosus]|uniref:F-box domain-containing protein n=1 Tax=Handroanthus impetiginosus TaxID=429701 RepID=A0A2G9GFZ7_9LAMI|nr:hypothetical protein CDL12_23350 [Handroanthus impetiginosus]
MASYQKPGKLEKKRAKTGVSGDVPSNLFSWRGEGCMPDGGIGDASMESGGEEELEGSHDPLVVFGSGVMTMILSKIDARSVALARLVSRGWREVASSDEIWAPKDFFHI